jgi:hypothetical protein
MDMFRALTIAGSDCSGGAGAQADLKTFHRFGVFGMSALTHITAQNTRGVQEVHALPPELVVMQIKSVMDDLGTDVAKTGALGSVEIIEAVAGAVQRFGLTKLVVDPVMISKHGDSLLDQIAIDALTQAFVTTWQGVRQPVDLREGETGTIRFTLTNNSLRARKYYFYLGLTGTTEYPYDIWDGVGTEFQVVYPNDVSNLNFNLGADVALVTLPCEVEIKKNYC